MKWATALWHHRPFREKRLFFAARRTFTESRTELENARQLARKFTKAEIRGPKSERRPKPEARREQANTRGFGFRGSGFRISGVKLTFANKFYLAQAQRRKNLATASVRVRTCSFS